MQGLCLNPCNTECSLNTACVANTTCPPQEEMSLCMMMMMMMMIMMIMLQEEMSLCMMMRSSRTEPPDLTSCVAKTTEDMIGECRSSDDRSVTIRA